jgi:hypothetical protein
LNDTTATSLPIASATGEISNISFYLQQQLGFFDPNPIDDVGSVVPSPIVVPLEWSSIVPWGDSGETYFSLILVNEDMDVFFHLNSDDLSISDEDKAIGRFNISISFPRMGKWIAGVHFYFHWGEAVVAIDVSTSFLVLSGPPNLLIYQSRPGFNNVQVGNMGDVE